MINDEVAYEVASDTVGAKRLDHPVQSNILPAKKANKDMVGEEAGTMDVEECVHDVSDMETVDVTEKSKGPLTNSMRVKPPVASMAKRLKR